jgi:hypothetical protein
LPIAMLPQVFLWTPILTLKYEPTWPIINFFHQLFEWLKFIESSMAMIMGSVKYEKCLFNLGFMKRKLMNKLIAHFYLVVKMFAHKFFMLNPFPFVLTTSSWTITKSCHGVKG